MHALTQDLVRTLLDYNAETGVLVWKPREASLFKSEAAWRRWSAQWPGRPAGSVYGKVPHRQILDTTAQRIIWLWVHGVLPKQITHLNGDTLDNRLANLSVYTPLPDQERAGPRRLTREHAAEIFDLDADTGRLRWRVRPRSHFRSDRGHRTANSKLAGKLVGEGGRSSRYLTVRVCGLTWYVHRIVWLLWTGELPDTIDHINRDTKDNRPSNLRPCSQSENAINRSARAAGRISGAVEAKPGLWRASLGAYNKRIHLGYHKTREAAEQAYQTALRDTFGEFVPNV